MTTSLDQQLIATLRAEHLLTKDHEEQIQAAQNKEPPLKGSELELFILNNSMVPEDQFFATKSALFNIPYVDLRGVRIPHDVLSLIPKEIARTYQMICFKQQDKALFIALADPANYKAQEAASFLVKGSAREVHYALTSRAAFEETFKQYDELPQEIEKVLEIAKDKVLVLPKEDHEEALLETPETIKAAPVSKIVSVIVRHAVEAGASDIHIEPTEDMSRIRYRVDGILETALKLPLNLHSSIVARIKVLANLRLDETRRPQDGRIRVSADNKDVDIRVSTLPLLDNEKVVMRLLDLSASTITLQSLGFHTRDEKIVRYAIGKPHGIFLITGPTGSGKTTTLYACMNILNKETVNIVTVEDPVEYFLAGINQSQINPEVGLTFAAGLRSILRQDPNIVMVGEIRDTETAELVIHAGLTGHLVLTTLHTKDALGALPRLIDMKVEPFLIASTLNAVSAQRLVRKLCEFCKEPATINATVRSEVERDLASIPVAYNKEMNIDIAKLARAPFLRGKGCPRCQQQGYKGRTVIAEFLVNTPELQRIITAGCTYDDLLHEFHRQGMITMKQDGLIKALEGITSLEEVLRVIQE